MNKISISYYKSPVGSIIIGSLDGKLCLCDWQYRKMRSAIDHRIQKKLNAEYIEENSEISEMTILQLSQYFQRERKEFSIPLLLAGTDFQQRVWETLIQIPFGKTESYLGLSNILGNPKAIRAVASANGANSISIIIPCHRIIGTDNSLVGYAGGLLAKKKLLELEGVILDKQLKLFT